MTHDYNNDNDIFLLKLIFYVLSDDIPKAKEKLTNVNFNSTYSIVYVGNGDSTEPSVDLALLSLSNHSILSYGSFSMCGALLATNKDHEVIMSKDYALMDFGERINMTKTKLSRNKELL